MKYKLIFLIVILLNFGNLNAQRQNRIGYIDMEYILKSIPEYHEANAQLDLKIEQWKKEIDLKESEIKSLKQDLDNERPLLTPDLIEEREEEITYQQKKLQEYQQQRFGTRGDMVKQSEQIVRPIQDQVFNIIQEIGLDREYDFIFDSSSEALMLFSAERHDISDQILASINRNAKRLEREKELEQRQLERADGEFPYKSVRQARIDEEKEKAREDERRQIEEERRARLDAQHRERDSIREIQLKKQTEKQDELARERQAKKDSTEAARQKLFQERQMRRDSIIKARERIRQNQ